MKFEGEKVIAEYKELFGGKAPDVYQMQWLIKFAKHIRGRCRSNAALKNYLARSFPNIMFSEVEREWKGRKYMALTYTDKTNKYVAVDEQEEE